MPLRQPIAIVGLGLRLPPDVRSLDELGAALASGIPVGPAKGLRGALLGHDRPGTWLSDPLSLDTAALGIPEGEARTLDPQQRLLLGCARDALAGLSLGHDLRLGVFVGAGPHDWAHLQLRGRRVTQAWAGSGSLGAMLAGRLAYHLDATGPCVVTEAACASTFAALHLAALAIAQADADVALAGGVSLHLLPVLDAWMGGLGLMAASPPMQAFQADGAGLLRGEGAGLFLLAPLARAQAEGWPVHGVLLGSALTHNGRGQGLLSPSARGHARVAQAALASAGLDASRVVGIEASGVGRPVADAMEVSGLQRVYGGPRWLTSAKWQHGHLDAAAGVLALARALWMLREGRTLPAPREVRWLDALIDLRPASGQLLTAGDVIAVHGYGIQGSYGHLLLKAPTTMSPAPTPPERAPPVDVDAWLAVTLRDLVGPDLQVSATRPLAWQGVDSLTFEALRQRIAEELGVHLDQADVSAGHSPKELGKFLAGVSEAGQPPAPEDATRLGPFIAVAVVALALAAIVLAVTW